MASQPFLFVLYLRLLQRESKPPDASQGPPAHFVRSSKKSDAGSARYTLILSNDATLSASLSEQTLLVFDADMPVDAL
jgi:hypothetical protein